MDRKLNPVNKHKWRSQPDLVPGTSAPINVDQELHHLSVLSGVNFDIDVFKIIADLLRLNVNPNVLLDVLRKMATQSALQKENERDSAPPTAAPSDNAPSKDSRLNSRSVSDL